MHQLVGGTNWQASNLAPTKVRMTHRTSFLVVLGLLGREELGENLTYLLLLSAHLPSHRHPCAHTHTHRTSESKHKLTVLVTQEHYPTAACISQG